MGSIKEHNLSFYIRNYNLVNYFETGTGEGECLAFALQHPFKKFYTIDIDGDLIQFVRNKFKFCNKDLKTFVGKSTEVLQELIPQLATLGPTLFFLDAHFPGADFHKCTYEESIRFYKQDAFPLENEIKLILNNRDVSRDVFIIDDYILYDEKGDYETIQQGVVWKYSWLQEELNLKTDSQFLFNSFKETHKLHKDLRSQGYLIATPKKKPSDESNKNEI